MAVLLNEGAGVCRRSGRRLRSSCIDLSQHPPSQRYAKFQMLCCNRVYDKTRSSVGGCLTVNAIATKHSKPPKPSKTRPASYDHLHPEPLVDCSVLYSPAEPTVDVIFVHGLYGSQANTWRQGEWRSRYDKEITKVPLRRPHSIPTCKCTDESTTCTEKQETELNVKTKINVSQTGRNVNVTGINEGLNKQYLMNDKFNERSNHITDDDIFITEKFYTHHQVEIINYDTQAQFVRDLFESANEVKPSDESANEVKPSDCKCDMKCEVGCGCVCDKCYSPCWPRDWVRVDYPGARVISINYTSDPYLWRPLWIKPSQRLRLHERAEQMMTQLLNLGVGQRPIIWVGHSKGGLFIKQIYCEAYEAYLNKNKDNVKETESNEQNTSECNNDNRINHCIDEYTDENNETICDKLDISTDTLNDKNANNNEIRINENILNVENINNDINGNVQSVEKETGNKVSAYMRDAWSLYRCSAGFLFYSVPHRGSPLADIKAPLTARSVELMEICKDCPLVLELQERWRRATVAQPSVRSLVETDRTLMSVLYLRIVSVDSADPGTGSLNGVSVDHREICKPSSRHCVLYKELMTLMRTALKKYYSEEH